MRQALVGRGPIHDCTAAVEVCSFVPAPGEAAVRENVAARPTARIQGQRISRGIGRRAVAPAQQPFKKSRCRPRFTVFAVLADGPCRWSEAARGSHRGCVSGAARCSTYDQRILHWPEGYPKLGTTDYRRLSSRHRRTRVLDWLSRDLATPTFAPRMPDTSGTGRPPLKALALSLCGQRWM